MGLKQDIVLHIGAPKCGSSSLQSVLSKHSEFQSRSGLSYSYVVATHRGTLRSGKDLNRTAKKSVFGYESSPNLVPGGDNSWLGSVAGKIRTLVDAGTTPILSSEGWMTRAKLFRESRFLENANLSAHVIAFVRPPLEWLNSSWWQWGIWSNTDIDKYVRRNIEATRWNALLSAWEDVPGVERVTVRLASSDTVSSFFEVLDSDCPEHARTNNSLPRSLLYFLDRNREFRKDAHSPQVEFAAARQLEWSQPTPWVMREDHAGYVLHHLYQPNSNLLHKLSETDRRLVENDPKWWDYAHYKMRELSRAEDFTTFEQRKLLATAMATKLMDSGCRLPKGAVSPAKWSSSDSVEVTDKSTAVLLREIVKLDERLRARNSGA